MSTTAIVATTGNDASLVGGDGRDILIGKSGDDVIDGGLGSDALLGGAGNDLLIYDESDWKIDGGADIDTLRFAGTAQRLDITSVKNVSRIEQIQLWGGGFHELTVSAQNVMSVSETDQLVIWGDKTNTVNPGAEWVFQGLSTDGIFSVFKSGSASLYIETPIYVTGFSGNSIISDSRPNGMEVTEDQSDTALQVSGVLSVQDPNFPGQSLLMTRVETRASNLGALTLSTDGVFVGTSKGAYTYTVDNAAVQYLGGNDFKEELFQVTAIDGTTKSITVVIRGVNDPATIGNAPNTVLQEDGPSTLSGTISVEDVDQNQQGFSTTVNTVSSNLGHLTIDRNGNYSYSVDSTKTQYLQAGEEKLEFFTIFSLDETSKEIIISIQGNNDPAVIGNPSNAYLKDDGTSSQFEISGEIHISDDDAGESYFSEGVVLASNAASKLFINKDGTYTYQVQGDSIRPLAEGETRTDTFKIQSVDGTIKYIDFVTEGSGTDAIIGEINGDVDLTEDESSEVLRASGKISITDLDAGEAMFDTAVISQEGNLGKLTLQPDGNYMYEIENRAVQYLPIDGARTEKFTITSKDGSTSKDIEFTIHGKNDVPRFTGIGESPGPDQEKMQFFLSLPDDEDDAKLTFYPSTSVFIFDPDQGDNLTLTKFSPSPGNPFSLTFRLIEFADYGSSSFEGLSEDIEGNPEYAPLWPISFEIYMPVDVREQMKSQNQAAYEFKVDVEIMDIIGTKMIDQIEVKMVNDFFV